MSTKAAVACRSCTASGLDVVLSLGKSPLANSLLSAADLDKPEQTFPLDLAFCPRCSLVQITESVPPEKMFREYLYMSSVSDTMVAHAEKIASRMVERLGLGADSLALEVASNDGYLLQHYKKRGVPVLGIEPARNIAEVAERERGIRTIAEFFGTELAADLVAKGHRADVIHANNVLAHVPDLNGFVEGIRLVLKERGVAVIEAPYVKDFVDHTEFDTIYHEHLCYFSLTALDRLMTRHELVIVDVERLPIHGGSLRLFMSHARGHARGAATDALLAEENAAGIPELGFYETFASRVARLKEDLRKTLQEQKAQGKRIAAYGAAAKGSTLLNYFGIGAETIDFVADRSPYKQGRFMPGVRIPIVPPSELLAKKPDVCLLLTWNFADEILAQQAEYRRAGGKFIVPIPEVKIV